MKANGWVEPICGFGKGSENGEVGDDVYEENCSVKGIDFSMQGDMKETRPDLAELGVAMEARFCEIFL